MVCGVIGDGAGRVLICRRKAGGACGGLWDFPGGELEQGENAEEGLARELEEELGIRVEVYGRVGPDDFREGEGVKLRLRAFRCILKEGGVEALEHEEIAWRRPAELKELRMSPADLPIVEGLGVCVSNLRN